MKYQVWAKHYLCDLQVDFESESLEEANKFIEENAPFYPKATFWIQTRKFTNWLNENFEEDMP